MKRALAVYLFRPVRACGACHTRVRGGSAASMEAGSSGAVMDDAVLGHIFSFLELKER
jgi:hypothetical protein